MDLGSDKKELEFSFKKQYSENCNFFVPKAFVKHRAYGIGHRHYYCDNVSRFLTNFLSPENSIISMSLSRTRFSIISFRDFVLEAGLLV